MSQEYAEIRNNTYVVASNWFVNRCPLVMRVPRVPVGSTTFSLGFKQGGAAGHILQFCQTWQYPARAGMPLTNTGTGGTKAPFEPSKMDALQNLADDMEFTSYYGKGEDPAIALRPKQKGLRTLIGNNVTAHPMNADAYTPVDLARDTFDVCRANGGDADVLLVSSNFMTLFATWGQTATRIDAGVNVFGQPIDVFEVPFLAGISVIEAPLLKPFTAIALTSSEVRLRMKRNEFWNPRGVRGDPYEGDWVAEGAIELDNPAHHAWVEGVTAAAGVPSHPSINRS